MIQAVIFDMDGVLIDSEAEWTAAREAYARASGGTWSDSAQRDMMGMSSLEWSLYMRDRLGVPADPEQISSDVLDCMIASYGERLPLIDGAVEAVQRIAARWPIALASSANRPLIDLALTESGLASYFEATVSSEEVARGKPAPDVYLEAARRIGVDPAAAVAVEDSTNGILAARNAGLRTIAIPNPAFPPSADAIAAADVVIDSIGRLTPDVVEP